MTLAQQIEHAKAMREYYQRQGKTKAMSAWTDTAQGFADKTTQMGTRGKHQEGIMNEREPIKVIFDATCPVRACAWQATFGDWDLGAPMGCGGSPEEAIEALKWDAGEDDE